MRTFLTFFFFVSTLMAQPKDNYTCEPAREVVLKENMEHELSDLRMGILVLSQFEINSSRDAANLQTVAQEAVFAFANDASVHADQLQRCSLSIDEYFSQNWQLSRFVYRLNETTGRDLFVALLRRWPIPEIEPLVGHMVVNPDLRGRKLPLHPVIENTLASLARRWHGPVDGTDPVQVAASELLGEKVSWSVSGFKPIKRLPLNPDNILNNSEFFYTDQLEEFRVKPISERVAILAEVYRSSP